MYASDLCTKALRAINAIGQADVASPYELSVAFDTLNDMIDGWAAFKAEDVLSIRNWGPSAEGLAQGTVAGIAASLAELSEDFDGLVGELVEKGVIEPEEEKAETGDLKITPITSMPGAETKAPDEKTRAVMAAHEDEE